MTKKQGASMSMRVWTMRIQRNSMLCFYLGGVEHRIHPRAQQFVRELDRNNKPIAVICHAPWLLVSAELVRGRTITSYHTIQDDIRNAGGKWQDQEVVRDKNWVSSRQPSDIPAFSYAMIELFSEKRKAGVGRARKVA